MIFKNMGTEEDSLLEIEAVEGGLQATIKVDPVDPSELKERLLQIENLVRVSFMAPVGTLKSYAFLAGLKSLQRVHLNACPKGTNLDALAELPLLEEITTGTRCFFDCSMLSDLPRLKIFRSGPNATSLRCIRECGSLEWVELQGAKFPDCSFLGGMPNLARLRLWDCKIDGTCGLETSNHLARLDFGQSRVNEINCLVGLRKLNVLELSSCAKITDPEPIANCPDIALLDISNCRFVMDSKILAKLQALEVFRGVGITISTELAVALKSLPNLRKLSVSKRYQTMFSGLSAAVKLITY